MSSSSAAPDPLSLNEAFKEAQKLYSKFNESFNLEDLDKAIQLQKFVNSNSRKDDVNLGCYYNNLSAYLITRVNYSDFRMSKTYVAEAIDAARAALRIAPPGHHNRSIYLQSLSAKLQWRYTRFSALQDLEESVQLAREAPTCAGDDNEKNLCRSNLRQVLSRRFKRLGDKSDIDEAVTIGEDLLANDSGNIDLISDSASDYLTRFDSFKDGQDVRDLDAAHQLLEKAIAISRKGKSPNDRFSLPWVLASWSYLFELKYAKSYEKSDLEESINASEEALKSFNRTEADRTHRYNSLGRLYRLRYDSEKDLSDLNASTHNFQAASQHEKSSLLTRVRAWRGEGENHIEAHRWLDAKHAFQKALQALPKLTPMSVPRYDQLAFLDLVPGIGSLASSVLLKLGEPASSALLTLETGLGVTASIAMNSRTETPELDSLDPGIKAEYKKLRESLGQTFILPDISPTNVDDRMSERVRNADDLEALESRIEETLGLNPFVSPLRKCEILDLAQNGNLVSFNVNSLSSHAFIVTKTGIQALELPSLTIDLVQQHTAIWTTKLGSTQTRFAPVSDSEDEEMGNEDEAVLARRESLKWLWDAAVKPVLAASDLQSKPDGDTRHRPRIWWVGGGLMALVPLHAAGYHYDDSKANTMSQVTSSYISTLRSLRHARQKKWEKLKPKDRMLAVLVGRVPGWRRLNVEKEMIAIKEHVGNKLDITISEGHTKEEILRSLLDSTIGHFACHGELNPRDPTDSALILKDGVRLSVSDLSVKHYERPRLAYLSACSTAESNTRASIDESIHLANAFQLSGFSHVVGALWAAHDDAAVKVAGKFYEYLVSYAEEHSSVNEAVAFALHDAVMFYNKLCGGDKDFEKWAPFVHVGP